MEDGEAERPGEGALEEQRLLSPVLLCIMMSSCPSWYFSDMIPAMSGSSGLSMNFLWGLAQKIIQL